MKVDVESVGSFQKRVTMTVPPDQVRGELDKAYKKLAGRVRLAGFRPGKAPRKVLEARFGPQIEADVANDLIQATWQKALAAQDFQPVSQGSLAESSAVSAPSGFTFTITVDVRPSIELSVYTGLDVVYPSVELDEAEIDQAVTARLEGEAKLEEVTDRAVESGDMALVELAALDGDIELAREFGTMIRTEADPYYPGIESLVVGAPLNEERKGKVTFGADARTQAVAGRTLDVTVKVLSIQRYTVPTLSDELASSLGFEGGADGMRAALAGQIREQREALARNQARANLLEVLIKANRFDVPAAMVEQSLQMLVDELKEQQAWRTGRDKRTITFSEAQMADLRIRAEFAAKSALILEFVHKKEGIEVTDADLDAKYQEFADAQGQTIEAVKGRMMQGNMVQVLTERILEEKTLDWLLERANPVAPGAAQPTSGMQKVAEAMVKDQVEKKAKAKKAKADEAPKAEVKAEVDLSVLKGAVGAIKDALATGAHDADLAALLEAETTGKNRKGAVQAIEARIAEIG